MMTRRDALALLGSISAGPLVAARAGFAPRITSVRGSRAQQGDSTPSLARGAPSSAERTALITAGLGDGARVALQLIDALRRELPIDERRIYLTGQSMGGAGVWHMMAQRKAFFAGAAVCCGSVSSDDAADAAGTPLWSFHGDADAVVPVAVSRERIAALRKAGGRPLSTEYAGVGHNVWEWAYTEPALVRWMFSHRR